MLRKQLKYDGVFFEGQSPRDYYLQQLIGVTVLRSSSRQWGITASPLTKPPEPLQMNLFGEYIYIYIVCFPIGLQGRDYGLKMNYSILTRRDESIRAIRTPRTPRIWNVQALSFCEKRPECFAFYRFLIYICGTKYMFG